MSKLLLSAALVVAGIAGTAGAAIATEPAPQAAPTTAVTAAAAVKRAVAVVVVRTGGGHPGQSVFTLVGSSSPEEANILKLASTPAFWSARPKYAPAKVPAGRYTYKIEAGYGDKTKKRVIVVEGTPGTPKVVLDLIRMMTTNLNVPSAADVKVNFPPGFPFT